MRQLTGEAEKRAALVSEIEQLTGGIVEVEYEQEGAAGVIVRYGGGRSYEVHAVRPSVAVSTILENVRNAFVA